MAKNCPSLKERFSGYTGDYVPEEWDTGAAVGAELIEEEEERARLDLYEKLAVAEKEIAEGAKCEDFRTAAREVWERVFGTEL